MKCRKRGLAFGIGQIFRQNQKSKLKLIKSAQTRIIFYAILKAVLVTVATAAYINEAEEAGQKS